MSLVKRLGIAVGAAMLAAALLATGAEARNGRIAAGIVGGVAAGALVGAAVGGTYWGPAPPLYPYYHYGYYGYPVQSWGPGPYSEPGPFWGPDPLDGCYPHAVWTGRHWRRVRVCD